MFKRYRRIIFRIVFIIGIFVAFRYACNALLGSTVKHLFENGTGCSLSLKNPQLSFFPLSGSIEDVELQLRDEAPRGFFRAKRVSVRMHLLPLLWKRVSLYNLILEEAQVSSLRDDSSFIRLMTFLFADADQAAPAWHSFLTAGWKTHCRDVGAFAAKAATPSFQIRAGEYLFAWSDLRLFADIPPALEEPNAIDSSASLFRVTYKETQSVDFGRFAAQGDILHGIIRVFHGALWAGGPEPAAEESPDSVHFRGKALLNAHNVYDFTIHGILGPQYNTVLLPLFNKEISQFRPTLKLEAHISGALEKPEATGLLKLALAKAPIANTYHDCHSGGAELSFKLNPTDLVIDNLLVPSLGLAGLGHLHFVEPFPFELTLTPDKGKAVGIAQACLLPLLASSNKVLLHQVAENSASAFTVDSFQFNSKGTLRPLAVETIVESSLQPILSQESSSLRLTASYSANRWVGSLSEEGRSKKGESYNLRAQASYVPETKLFSLPELRADKYPLPRILKYAALFVDSQMLDRALPYLNQESILDGKLELVELPFASQPSGRGNFVLRNLSDTPCPLFHAELSLNAGQQNKSAEFSIQSACGNLQGQASLLANGELQGNLRAPLINVDKIPWWQKHFPAQPALASLRAELGGSWPAPSYRGTLELQSGFPPELRSVASFSGNKRGLRLEISELALPLESSVLKNKGALQLEYNADELSIISANLLFASHELLARGGFSISNGWNMEFLGTTDLETLRSQIPLLEEASGAIQLALRVSGPFEQPVVDGTLRLSDGSLLLPIADSAVNIHKLRLEGEFKRGDFHILHLSGRIAEGRLSGSGELRDVLLSERRSGVLQLRFEQAALEPLAGLFLQGDGALELSGSAGEGLLLAGNVLLTRSYYQHQVDLLTLLRDLSPMITGVSRVEKVHASAEQALLFNIKLQNTNPAFIDTNLFKGQLRGQLVLQGSLRQPALSGEIEAPEGTIDLQGNKFELIHGRLNFPQDGLYLDPELDIVSESSIHTLAGEEHIVQLSLYGTLSSPQVNLASASNLSEREILSILAFGSRAENVFFLPKGQKASEVSYLDLLNPRSELSLTERFSGLIGFSELQVDTVSSRTETGYVPVISARRPIIDGTDITLSSELGQQQTSSANINHPLSGKLRLYSGWESRSRVNPQTNTGALEFGLRYQSSFPGSSLLPRLKLFKGE